MKLTVVILSVVLFASTISALSVLPNTVDIGTEDECDCPTYDSCACCAWEIPVISNVCVNVTWEDYQVHTYLIINDQIVAQRVITDPRENVDVCASVECDVCVTFENLNISYTGACGSIYLNVTCNHYQYVEDLGDWHVGGECTLPSEAIKQPAEEDPEDAPIKIPFALLETARTKLAQMKEKLNQNERPAEVPLREV